ncbi:MAG TPA: cupin domain-containing protein [Rhodopila sp.]
MTQPTLRRDIVLATLAASLPAGFLETAQASPLNPRQTIIRPPGELHWKTNPAYPEPSVESCPLTGDPTKPGLYYGLVRWWPGFMSAPHTYTTDRFCVVVSGTWWCNSGPDFDPASCVPVSAGSFVHRVAHTPHYDGVVKGHPEPAVIAICGVGPVNFALVDSTQPSVRRL